MSERLIEIKQNYLDVLHKKIAAEFETMASATGADKVSCQKTIDGLEREIKKLESELELELESERLKSSAKSYNEAFKKWEENFYKINFKQAGKILGDILSRFEDKEGAVFFLLQNSQTMGGKWCINKLEKFLQGEGVWNRPYRVGFSSWEQPSPEDFLKRLGGELGVEEPSAQTIIDKIFKSLQSGSIVFLELTLFTASTDDNLLDWFFKYFWVPLVAKLSDVCQEHPLVKFVAVVAVNDSVSENCLAPELYCTEQSFSSNKVLNLPLQEWTEAEIKTWLLRYSELNAPNVGRTPQEMGKMAKSVYRVTKGVPLEVYSVLMEELTKVLAESKEVKRN